MADWNKTLQIGKYTFTVMEIRDLIISAFVLGLIFAVRNWSLNNWLFATAVAAPALIFHEIAHKIMAQRYELAASYIMWPTGIAISLLLTIFSNGALIFAALGAVVISSTFHTRLGYRFIGLTSGQLGKIALAGPMTNIVLAIIFYVLRPINTYFFDLGITINLIVAIFNCFPVPPLDGAKIFRWNIPLWLGVLVTAVLLLVLPNIIGIEITLVVAVIAIIAIFLFLQKVMPMTQQTVTEYR